MGRAMIALFIVSFFFDFVAFWTGVVGCWRRGAGNITSTAILMLLACKSCDSFVSTLSSNTVRNRLFATCYVGRLLVVSTSNSWHQSFSFFFLPPFLYIV